MRLGSYLKLIAVEHLGAIELEGLGKRPLWAFAILTAESLTHILIKKRTWEELYLHTHLSEEALLWGGVEDFITSCL